MTPEKKHESLTAALERVGFVMRGESWLRRLFDYTFTFGGSNG